MAEICNAPQLQKGERIVLKWTKHDFEPHLVGTLDFECIEGPIYEIGGRKFKILIFPWFKERPERVTCFLTREGQHSPAFTNYFVDAEITIDRCKWKQPQITCRMQNSQAKYLPLLNLPDLRNKKFPEQSKLILQFTFRKCKIKRICPRYASATTELKMAAASRFSSFNNLDSPETGYEPAEEFVPENVENEVPLDDSSNTKKTGIKHCVLYCSDQECLKVSFGTEWDSVFLRYEIRLIDVKRNVVIASQEDEIFILLPYIWMISDLPLPRDFIEQIESSPSDWNDMRIYTSVSYHNVQFKKDSRVKYSCFFFLIKKHLTLKTDLQNLYHNRARRADVSIKSDEHIFQAHRCILAARSPVFKAMLQNDTLEKRTGLIKTVEMSSEVLRLLLKFIYSSEFEKGLGYKVAASLYAAADKYGILSLIPVCRRELKKNISKDNIYEILLMFYLYRDVEMKEFLAPVLKAWYPKMDAISYLDNIHIRRPMMEEDISFLRG